MMFLLFPVTKVAIRCKKLSAEPEYFSKCDVPLRPGVDSIMGRPLVDRPLPGVAQGTHVFGQFGHHGFQLIDAASLLVDCAVEGVDEVFLVGQLDFDVDKTVFVAHVAILG
jgi:hypothetical protein